MGEETLNFNIWNSIILAGLLQGFSGAALTATVLLHCYSMMSEYQRGIKNKQVRDTISGVGWFKKMALGLLALCILWLAQLVYVVVNAVYIPFYVLWIGMSVIIYWLGHVGIYKYGVQQERKKIRSYSIEHRSSFVPAKQQKNEHVAGLEKLVVQQKAFLDPTLTLDKVAEQLNLSTSHMSRIINTELGMGFPDYLNSLRVAEAKSHLNNPEFANYTLVAIGLEAGFNSKTTFNMTFKKFTSLTPSEYRNSQLEQNL